MTIQNEVVKKTISISERLWETLNKRKDVQEGSFEKTIWKLLTKEDDGMTLKDVLIKFPELKEMPEFNPDEYGVSAENLLEAIAKYTKEKTSMIIERNNRDDKFDTDFKILDSNKELIAYADAEQDYTGAFYEEDGHFKYWDLTIPIEKKKHFFRDKPFFYIKINVASGYCYVLDGWAVRDLLEETTVLRSLPNGNKINREMMTIKSSAVFNRKLPYGVHRLRINDWLKAVIYFMKLRYSQQKIEEWLK